MTRPIVKMAGGKSNLVDTYLCIFPAKIEGNYFEPMVGGGAVALALAEEEMVEGDAFLNDLNFHLINFYERVLEGTDEFFQCLDQLASDYLSDPMHHYYQCRDRYNESEDPDERAALFFYINRMGYNGLWRVNKGGGCNVPWGHKKECYFDIENLKEWVSLMEGATLFSQDFSEVIRMADEGDFVYFDPPYVRVDPTAFVSYTSSGFGKADHMRLAFECRSLDRSGVLWAVSGLDTDLYRDLFSGFNFHEVMARRSISRDGSGREPVKELLICNF